MPNYSIITYSAELKTKLPYPSKNTSNQKWAFYIKKGQNDRARHFQGQFF